MQQIFSNSNTYEVEDMIALVPQKDLKDQERLRELKREVLLSRSISMHKNIMPTYGALKHNKHKLVVATKNGKPLSQILLEGKIKFLFYNERLEMVVGILKGLGEMIDKNNLTEITSENIVFPNFEEDKTPKIFFNVFATSTKSHYLSPETIRTQSSLIYSLGVLIHEILRGESEKTGIKNLEILKNTGEKVDIHQSIQDIISNALNQDPSLRPKFKDFRICFQNAFENKKFDLAETLEKIQQLLNYEEKN